MTSRIRRVAQSGSALALLCGCLLLPVSAALGQDVTEPSLKAAFIYSFIRFTEWPTDALPVGAPLTVCVLGDMAVGDVLENYVKGQPVDGHAIVVSRVVAGGLLRPCHLLYVAGVTATQAAQVTAGLNGAPVLTMSDIDPFARAGGMAQLFFEQGRIHFRINLDNAKRARLRLSSKLLSLATIVTDAPNAIAR